MGTPTRHAETFGFPNARRKQNHDVIVISAQHVTVLCNFSKMNSPHCPLDNSRTYSKNPNRGVCLVNNGTVQCCNKLYNRLKIYVFMTVNEL